MAIKELVQNALADNIDQLRSDFGTEIGGRLAERMGERKQEIAKSYFGQAVTESVEEEITDASLVESDDEIVIESEEMAEARARTSSAYLFTHKPGDADSEAKLAAAKKAHPVRLQGRLGKNSPHAAHYSTKGKSKTTFGQHSHQRIKKAHASHFDVYKK